MDGSPVEPDIQEVTLSAEAAERAGFETFMLKEIHEQPRVLRSLLQRHAEEQGPEQIKDIARASLMADFFAVRIEEEGLFDDLKTMIASITPPTPVPALDRLKAITAKSDSPTTFIDAVKQHKPDILGMSALLTTTMPRMGEIINALTEAGIRDQVKVIVGGAPVTKDYAEKIGADAYGANAAMAVDTGKELVGI